MELYQIAIIGERHSSNWGRKILNNSHHDYIEEKKLSLQLRTQFAGEQIQKKNHA